MPIRLRPALVAPVVAATLLITTSASAAPARGGPPRSRPTVVHSRMLTVHHGSTVRLPPSHRGTITTTTTQAGRARPSRLIPKGRGEIVLRRAPSGRTLREWSAGTFGSALESARYHVAKHGDGRTIAQYTREAVRLRREASAKVKPTRLKSDGAMGTTRRTADGRGGIFSGAGRVISFWLK